MRKNYVVFVCGQQCKIENGVQRLGRRYRDLLDHVEAVLRYEKSKHSREPTVVIPAGWLFAWPRLYGELAKERLVSRGISASQVLIYSSASDPCFEPARTTFEEVEAFASLADGDGDGHILICEEKQVWRVRRMAEAFGLTKLDYRPVLREYTPKQWLYEAVLNLLTLPRSIPVLRFINRILALKRGPRYP